MSVISGTNIFLPPGDDHGAAEPEEEAAEESSGEPTQEQSSTSGSEEVVDTDVTAAKQDSAQPAGPQELPPSAWMQLRQAAGVEIWSFESLVYITFLLLLTIDGARRIDADHSRFAAHLASELVQRHGFHGISDARGFWRFAEGPLTSATLGSSGLRFQSVLPAPPRLRQLRVRNDSCLSRHDQLTRPGRPCYDRFSEFAEDTAPHGSRAHSAPDGPDYRGLHGTYHAGGFVVYLPMDQAAAEEAVKLLGRSGWIDEGTRAVFAELVAYNADADLFCVATLVVEFPPQGGATPSWRLGVMRLPRYHAWELFLPYLDLAVISLALLQLALRAARVAKYGLRDYPWWLTFSTARWSVFFGALVWGVIDTFFVIHARGINAASGLDDYAQMEAAHQLFSDTYGVLLAATWIGNVSYLRVSKSARRLWRALRRCWRELVLALAALYLSFLAAAVLAARVLGLGPGSFVAFLQAAFSLLRGYVDHDEVRDAGWHLELLLFFSFLFAVFFVLSSVTTAIVFKAYSETGPEESLWVVSLLKKGLRPFRVRPPARRRLFERGFTRRDIDMLWAELGLDPGHSTGFQEALARTAPREDEPTLGPRFVTRHEVEALDWRVSAMTASFESASHALSVALDR